jgi:hypothetical protein
MRKMSEMPDNARVWLYQASRYLSESEVNMLQTEVSSFLSEWTSHGVSMDAAFEIAHNRILVIAADESKASGCGIDKSVKCIQDLGNRLGIDFFQRTVVLYMKNEEWCESQLHEFWGLRKALIVNDETPVLDTTVRSVGEYRAGFQKLFSRSWHADMWGR